MQQTLFPFQSGNIYHIDEFISSSCNHYAYNAIYNWKKEWGCDPYKNVLMIHGDDRSGKTYLANIWGQISGAQFIKNNELLDEEKIINSPGFIIDNFHINWDERLLLHYFNIISEYGKLLLITGSSSSNIKLMDLSSRIKAVRDIKISQPDDELLKSMLVKLFSSHSMSVEHDVMVYMLKVIPRDFKNISIIVDNINKFALRKQKKVTIPMIKYALSNYDKHENEVAT